TGLPYDTQNTRNFTNFGSMFGTVGFRFDCVTAAGRKRSLTFYNEGTVSGSTYVLVNATNIISPGPLLTSSSGLLKLEGNNINLVGASLLAGTSASGQV